jgi:hypothetical protein
VEEPEVQVEEIGGTHDPVKHPEYERQPDPNMVLNWNVDEDRDQESEPGYNVLYDEDLI